MRPASDAIAAVGGNFLMAGVGIQSASKGADAVVQASMGFSVKRSAATQRLQVYDVGSYQDLRSKVPGLDAHHAGQSVVMARLVRGYDRSSAPAILVPKLGHTVGKNGVGVVSRPKINNRTGLPFDNARDLMARDIRELRRVYPEIPNSQLQMLIEKNKAMYPEMKRPGK